MNRRNILRTLGGTLASAGSVAIAGCSGGDGDDDDGDESEDVEPAPEPSGESIGSVVENTVEELVIIDWTSGETDFGAFQVELTIYNEGTETTDLFGYNHDLTLYDENDTDITGSSSGERDGDTIGPGEQGTTSAHRAAEGGASKVARYEITQNCEGVIGEPDYCE